MAVRVRLGGKKKSPEATLYREGQAGNRVPSDNTLTGKKGRFHHSKMQGGSQGETFQGCSYRTYELQRWLTWGHSADRTGLSEENLKPQSTALSA